MKYFISDLHFSHQNIIKYCGRPWDNYKGMNAALISKWNSVVTETDEVYVLGDVFLGSHHNELHGIMNRLNGTKFLILGNHDLLTPWQYIECGFRSVHTHLEVEIKDMKINLIHDPAPACGVEQCNPHPWLHGHLHGLKINNPNLFNVSVECNNYTPVSEDVIYKYFKGDRK